jgi:hypothetical protein
MFALGRPGAFEALLQAVGFRDVAVRTVDAPQRYPSTAEAVRYLRESAPLLREATAPLAEAERGALWAEIEAQLRRFEGPADFAAPGAVLVGAGAREREQ